MKASDLIACYPRLFHMAEKGTWPSMKVRGLLSTSAILDLHGITGARRVELEENHRPAKVIVGSEPSNMSLRDQKPMPPARLDRALIGGTSPKQWYKFLNGLVFMWVREERLLGLLNAQSYRNLEHDVLTIDTACLLKSYEQSIWLCRMNSGNTWPFPQARSLNDFKRIADYPVKEVSGLPQKKVVELVVEYSVPDIARYVVEVRRMRGSAVLGHLSL